MVAVEEEVFPSLMPFPASESDLMVGWGGFLFFFGRRLRLAVFTRAYLCVSPVEPSGACF